MSQLRCSRSVTVIVLAASVLASLQVAHPISAPGLDGPHIILVQPDNRMNFYIGSRWPAPLPDMLEALAVETLRASGEWQTVQDSASPFTSEYLLNATFQTKIKLKKSPPPPHPKPGRYSFRFSHSFAAVAGTTNGGPTSAFTGTISGTIDKPNGVKGPRPPRSQGKLNIEDLDVDPAHPNCSTLGTKGWGGLPLTPV